MIQYFINYEQEKKNRIFIDLSPHQPNIWPCSESYHFRKITKNSLTTNTHMIVLWPFVRVYPGEPVPEETSIHSHPSCSSTILIIFLHLPRTTASSLLNPRTWDSLCTTSNHVLFGLSLGLEPTTSYSVHFFTNHYHPFAPYVHTIVTCFAIVATLCPLFLVSCLLYTSDAADE